MSGRRTGEVPGLSHARQARELVAGYAGLAGQGSRPVACRRCVDDDAVRRPGTASAPAPGGSAAPGHRLCLEDPLLGVDREAEVPSGGDLRDAGQRGDLNPAGDGEGVAVAQLGPAVAARGQHGAV